MNPYVEPHYLIQINNTGSESLSKILRIPPSVITVQDAIKRYGEEDWKKMSSFAITRNPYSRAVSIYSDYYYSNKFHMLEKNVSFLTFLNNVIKLKKKPIFDKPRFFKSQWSWLRNFRGKLGVRNLGRYEEFYEGVFTYLSIIGQDPTEFNLQPKKDRSPYPWQKYYEGKEGEMARELIREFWAEDFLNLNYKK